MSIALVALATGCGASTLVLGTMEYPASVPLRAFPHVVVTSGHEIPETDLARFLVAHLSAGGQIDARYVDGDTLASLRSRRELPSASVVVALELGAIEDIDVRMTSRPETICGPGGCYTRNRTVTIDVPQLRVRVSLTVQNGPSAEVLQQVSFEVLEEGRSAGTMLQRALRQLEHRLRDMVDPRVERVSLRLLRVDVAGVDAAIEALRAGRWRRGRIQLEQAARSTEVRALRHQDQARVFYDLGVARRFDPVSLAEDPGRHFQAAALALRRAIRLDPRERYVTALAELEAHRAQVELMRAQREAAAHNFQLREQRARPSGDVPPPPPAYLEQQPNGPQ